MIQASESCAMLIPLALAIFSTLFFYLKLYHDQAFFHIKMVSLPVDNFSRSGIRTVTFEISEEEKKIF